jgi:hypothetical protein
VAHLPVSRWVPLKSRFFRRRRAKTRQRLTTGGVSGGFLGNDIDKGCTKKQICLTSVVGMRMMEPSFERNTTLSLAQGMLPCQRIDVSSFQNSRSNNWKTASRPLS